MQTKANTISSVETNNLNPFIESDLIDTMSRVSQKLTMLQLLTTAQTEFFAKSESSGLFYFLGCMDSALNYAMDRGVGGDEQYLFEMQT